MDPLRSEQKWVAAFGAQDFALGWLRHVCLKDPLYPQGTVFSIYYDTPRLDLYDEKVHGDYQKTKVRLRWYDDLSKTSLREVKVFLEVKTKMGQAGKKVRKEFFIPVERLRRWDVDFLKDWGETHLAEFQEIPRPLFPILSIEYDRHRFVCPSLGARVSLDVRIRSSWINEEVVPSLGKTLAPLIVFELKGHHTMDIPWLTDLVRLGFRPQGYSKYAAMLSQILQGVPA
ncbi:MAG: VTC domain-containing protein [Chlamydiae bacterium]|nr:VTC domain-containing protein [Chlamydiota bacterium]MBI3266853.1 VTC domain-containing protein [Chlamydiota bacterium]